VLWQRPPQMNKPDPARVDRFLRALPRHVRPVVEFRSDAWYVDVAKPGVGALFVGWSAPCGAELECHLPMSGPTAVQADFVRAHPVHLVRMGDGSGEVVSADGSFRCGEQCEGL
jgi:hypothetical protein